MSPSPHIPHRWQIGGRREVTTAVWAVGLEALGAHKKRPGKVLGVSGKYCILRNTAISREDLFPLRPY